MVRTFFRTDDILIESAAAKPTDFLPFQVFLAGMPAGAADNSGPVGNDSADDDGDALFDDKTVSVKKGNDRIRCFFDANDVVRVDVHHLLVHAGQEYHGFTKIMEISL